MVEGVRAGLAAVEVCGWDPFGVAVVALSGGPAVAEEAVVGAAGQGELVDVGAVGVCLVCDVMDFAVVAGDIAARGRAAAVFGVQDDALAR